MTSFRKKVFVWCGTVFLLLTLSVTGVLVLSILYQFYHDERKELRELAHSINHIVDQNHEIHPWLGNTKFGTNNLETTLPKKNELGTEQTR